MPAGYPVKVNYLTGDVLTAADLNDLAGTVNLYDPTAKGDLFPATAADAVSRLAVGANDTVLTADSATATGLKWAAAAAGGMTSIASGSLTGASVALTSISGSYKDLLLIVRNFRPVDASAGLQFRFNGDSTANRHATQTGNGAGFSFTATSGDLGFGQNNTTSTSIYSVTIPDYANATTWKMLNNEMVGTNQADSANYNSRTSRTYYNQTGAVTSITLFPSTGDFTSGTYILYGVS